MINQNSVTQAITKIKFGTTFTKY